MLDLRDKKVMVAGAGISGLGAVHLLIIIYQEPVWFCMTAVKIRKKRKFRKN